METIPKLQNAMECSDPTSIDVTALNTLRERFTNAISQETAQKRTAALEDLIDECAAPLEVLASGAELSLEYELFLVTLSRMHMLESARHRLELILR